MRIPGFVNKAPHLPFWCAKQLQGVPLPDVSPATSISTAQSLVLNPGANRLSWQTIAASGPAEAITLTPFGPSWMSFDSGRVFTTIGNVGYVSFPGATKKLESSWVAGNYAGGRFNNVPYVDGTYHAFILREDATGNVDAGFDTSVMAANRPAGWSARRVGSFLRVNGAILPFTQFGWYFEHRTVQPDLAAFAATYYPTNYTLTVPKGLKVRAHGIFSTGIPQAWALMSFSIQSPDQNPMPLANTPLNSGFKGVVGSYSTAAPDFWFLGQSIALQVRTNTQGQIQIFNSGTPYYDSPYYSNWQTLGWFDYQLLKGL